MTLLVKDIAYVRSGDKGDVCSVGLVARGAQEYAQLLASVTPADVKALYGDWVQGEVECHPMDNIGAMMVIMRHALGGGATRTLRLDQTGKSLGHALLRLPVRDPN
ncbi:MULTISPECIES: hypothetical protein [Achromobacter]|jgi:hypothetical protein|uniref:AtuA-like ferredoxin-fold domain-containing protein n=1 Tax=Achromobacter mucicolens TaxID=1389922 RepID=A0ABM8LKT1_9BURK|nr:MULTISPECIES: hypothetical protein [Achromobacter]AVG44083.1 hypothetical protein MC81_31880 [Achromobacter insolitus]CAB3848234.1 hypothetical protein LMG3410_01632 [Achromobacter aegrifaciens]CAB3911872.1 hypothetical protein LMG3415_05015 [Achromobacter mucicolens]